MLVISVHYILIIFCKGNQSRQDFQRHTICLTDSDHGYFIDEIERKDKIGYEKYINAEDEE